MAAPDMELLASNEPFTDDQEEQPHTHTSSFRQKPVKALAVFSVVLAVGFCVAWHEHANNGVVADSTAPKSSIMLAESAEKKSCVAPNLLPNLVPASGAWRGSTFQPPLVAQHFSSVFGNKLTIWRTFHYPGYWEFSDAEKDWINSGNIIFYSTQPKAWATNSAEALDIQTIREIAHNIKNVAPAQVFFAPGYEPDGHSRESYEEGIIEENDVYGTNVEYRAFWKLIRQTFAEENVHNAVFILDFSTRVGIPPGGKDSTWNQVSNLWPGNGLVDWLAWNVFQNESKTDCVTIIDSAYNSFKSHSRGRNDYLGVPWAIGAWGTFEKDFQGQALSLHSRERCISGVTKAFIDNEYPHIRASIYFNSDRCVIMPADMKADMAEGDTNSPELLSDLTNNFAAGFFGGASCTS